MSTPAYPLYLTSAGQPDFTTAALVGQPLPEYKYGAAAPDAIIWTAPYWQLRSAYTRPDPNVKNCPADANARFSTDEGFREVGIGIVAFTRRWSTKPSTWTKAEPWTFRYPGYDVVGAARDPFTRTRPSLLVHEYFLVGPGGDYASKEDIPIPATFNFDGNYLTGTSDPTYAAYQALLAVNPWSLVLEVGLQQFEGNVYERVTRRLTAL